MRGGKFLGEESPETLLMKYQCETLEEVFLKLSILQNKGKRRRSSIAQEISDQVSMPSAMTVSFATVLMTNRFQEEEEEKTKMYRNFVFFFS